MTFQTALLRPDTGEAAPTGPRPTPAVAEPSWLDRATGWADGVPPIAWLALAAGLFAALMVMRWRLGKALHASPPRAKQNSNTKLGGLFYTAVGMSAILWAGVLLGSAKNLIGWGRDTLGWTGGWEYLVPATLDGVAIAFAVLMFAAVRAGRPANRAARVVWVATAVSALIGFSHEYDGTLAATFAAMYLAFLALGAMAILHELLDLFRSHTEKKVARISPVFGLRWITYMPNTVCAWLAWQNHPPRPLPANPTPEQLVWYGSVRHAVTHLNTVRRAKRIARYAVDVQDGRLAAPWWMKAIPWPRVRQLTAVAAEQIAAADAERAERNEIAARLEQITAEHRIAVVEAERLAEQTVRIGADRDEWKRCAEEAERDAERARSDAAEQIEKLRFETAERERQLLAEHAERIASLRQAGGESAGRGGRSIVTPFRRSKSAPKEANPMASDVGALAAMFEEHPEPGYEWRDREVHRITGAGFSSRAPRLTAMATEHQRTCPAEQHSRCYRVTANDDQEDSPSGRTATA